MKPFMAESYIGKEVEAEMNKRKVIIMVERQLFDVSKRVLYLWGKDRKGIPTRIILTRSDNGGIINEKKKNKI